MKLAELPNCRSAELRNRIIANPLARFALNSAIPQFSNSAIFPMRLPPEQLAALLRRLFRGAVRAAAGAR
jgi:hypothetical protein